MEVAIKLFPRTALREEEFRREAAIAMRNVHPNLVRLVDAGVHQGRAFLALEYVDGFNGRALLYRPGRTVDQVLDVVRQTFAALDAMHGAGLAHGDIKPENIIIQDRHVRVVDFGRTRLAHVLDISSRTHAGTPPYMHPGLFHGLPASAATDCFAAWVTAYELVCGTRPYTREALQNCPPDRLPDRAPLPDRALDVLIGAGLDGRLSDARMGWLAISRFQAGRRDLPARRPAPPRIEPTQVEQAIESLRAQRSVALLGEAELTRPWIDAVDRSWRRGGGTSVWLSTGWHPEAPLADALSMVADLAESQPGTVLTTVAAELGPLGAALAAAVPSARAWIDRPSTATTRPEPERLALALRRMLQACPPPVLVLTRAFDRVDGASRRLLRELVTAGVVHLVAAAPPGHAHGLARELRTTPLPIPTTPRAEAGLSRDARALLARARVLDLPFGRLLARAAGLTLSRVTDLALDIEAVGSARWTGSAVLARSGPLPGPESQRAIFAEAGRRLDAVREPWLVARYALRGGDSVRLAEVIDPAVELAARRAPADALELLLADPAPPTPDRLLRRFRIALQARDMAAAEDSLALLRDAEGASPADLAEAEGELAFRRGQTLTAIASYERAAAALGHPLPRGLRGILHDLRALWQIRRQRLPSPRPDARLARILGTLYGLQFNHDNAWLLRLHRMWLQSDPDDTRARATEVLWRQLLGMTDAALALDRELAQAFDEQVDPVGAAVVLLHRAIAAMLRGEVATAFSDAVDAATGLLRAGDPYAAALATTVPAVCAVHVAGAGPLARLQLGLTGLVQATGDERAERWAAGIDAVARWQVGDVQGAMSQARAWADGAQQRQDASEALARRFLAELYLERADWRQASSELQRAATVGRRLHVRMDYVEARVLDELIVLAQARLAGERLPTRRGTLERRAVRFSRRSPRWEPRRLVASAWLALSDDNPGTATERFDQACALAESRGQTMDAWWALHHRALALGDDASRAAADRFAADQHLRQGEDSLMGLPSPLDPPLPER